MSHGGLALLVYASLAIVACSRPTTTIARLNEAPTSKPASSTTTVASSTQVPIACSPDEIRYGSTCCSRDVDGQPTPGHVFLNCRGPRIGAPCTRKSDCDVLCACPGQAGRLSNLDGPSGPPDGTTGITGECGGIEQDGVWRCEIGETGQVTHVIIN